VKKSSAHLPSEGK